MMRLRVPVSSRSWVPCCAKPWVYPVTTLPTRGMELAAPVARHARTIHPSGLIWRKVDTSRDVCSFNLSNN